jgi:septal ring factor EnvC (AmiA/AmiB activator)
MPPPYFKNGIMKPVIGDYQAEFDGLGLIFFVKKQTPIFSPQSGKIIFSSTVPDMGTVIMIKHNNGQVSVIKGIIINNNLKKGIMLQAGQYIGHTGNQATFFYMLRKNAKVVDPRKMFVTVISVP